MNGSQSHVRCTITYEPAESWLDVVMVLEAWVTDYGPGLETWHVFHFSVWFMVWGIRKEAKGILKQGKAAPCKAKRYKKAKRGMARPLAGGGVVVGHLATHAVLRQYFHLMWKIKFLADSNMIICIFISRGFQYALLIKCYIGKESSCEATTGSMSSLTCKITLPSIQGIP